MESKTERCHTFTNLLPFLVFQGCAQNAEKYFVLFCTMKPKRELPPQESVEESEFSLSQIGNLSLVSNGGQCH